GAQPERAVALERLAGGDERTHGRLHATVGVERRLEVVVVEAHAERLQVQVLLLAQFGDGEAAHRVQVFDVAARGDVLVGEFDDVLAVITVRGELAGNAALFARARLDRQGEVVDLRTRVVVIELAGDTPALRFEKRADRV